MFQRKLGGVLVATVMIAAACTPAASTAPTTGPATGAPATGAPATGAPATAAPTTAAIGPGEGELNLIIWAGYAERGAIDPAYNWVTPFEEKTCCKVNTIEMTDSSNGVELMASGQYDGGSFSGNATDRLMASGLVNPVDTSIFTNYANVFEGLKNKPHNSQNGQNYGVPHGRGPNLLIYNTETFATPPTSWDPIFEGGADYKGKISIYGYSDFIAEAALHLMVKRPELGITNPYQLNDAQFAATIELLEALDANDPLYWGVYTDQMQSFGSGETVVGTTWQFQVNLLKADGAPVEAVLPAEGATGWSDTWMMYFNAKNPNCMLMWMDHMMSPEANGMATVWFGEAATSQAACDFAETLSPGHCELTHATDEAYYEKIWYWSTPRQDCADTDNATVCKNQAEWAEAWTTLTGS
jgi:putative spermidine/putrescine transport system substrate-binding protein